MSYRQGQGPRQGQEFVYQERFETDFQEYIPFISSVTMQTNIAS